MAIPLLPKKANPDRPIPGYGVFDIESENWIDFVLNGYYTKLYDVGRCEVGEIYRYFERSEEFSDFVFSEEQPHDVIYAHYGGKFDFNFILKDFYEDPRFYIDDMLPRNPGLLSFSVSTYTRNRGIPPGTSKRKIIKQLKTGEWLIKERTISFRDSFALLPSALKKLTESFDVKHKKKDFDFNLDIRAHLAEAIIYHEYDLKGLYEVIEKYYEWPIIRKSGFASTMASQSMKVYQTYMKDPIFSLSEHVEKFIRRSYYGGRTEIFRPYFQANLNEQQILLKSYDVNSLYPAVMKENPFPTRFDIDTPKYIDGKMGFYDVDVLVPPMYVPPLGVEFMYPDKTVKFIFPTGSFRGVFSSVELEYAMGLGVKILKVHRGMLFHNGGYIFKRFIEDLYEMRKQAKKNKDGVGSELTKLLMNSHYGRHGLRRDRERLVFDEGQLGIVPSLSIVDMDYKPFSLGTEPIYLENSYSNVAIAAWVTSHARILMHKNYLSCENELYYTDTDSLYTTKEMPSNQDNLGELKFEHAYDMATFLLPKTYYLNSIKQEFPIYKNGKILSEKTNVKITAKGFNKDSIKHWTADAFVRGLEGDFSLLSAKTPAKFAPLKTASQKGKFLHLIKESDREIRSIYNKRRIFKRDWGNVYDSEPLHVEGGEIRNLDLNSVKTRKQKRKKSGISLHP